MENLEWLRESMRNNVSNSARNGPTETVLRFPNAVRSATRRDGATALELVYQAADVIKAIEARANETEKQAQSIAEKAVEQLQFAEKRIQELEANQRTAEAWISEASSKLRKAADAFRQEKLRVGALEKKLHQIEQHARTAEEHAAEREKTITRIEDAIRIHLLGQRTSGSEISASAG